MKLTTSVLRVMIATPTQTFEQLCAEHPDQMFEQTIYGDVISVAPIGGMGGRQEAELITDVNLWNRQAQLGYVFSSQTIFALPIGSKRAPDVAWVAKERWDTLTPQQQNGFPPLCPDFVIELRSTSDALAPLRAKMLEYLVAKLRLGWLINPQDSSVEIYQQDQPIQVKPIPCTLTGEDVLPGFELNVS